MKPADPPVLRATRLLDQVRERLRYKHYRLRTAMHHSFATHLLQSGRVQFRRPLPVVEQTCKADSLRRQLGA